MNSEHSVELVYGSKRPNISFNGKLLYSESSTPEKRLEGLTAAPQTLYIIISPLLFYGIDILESLITPDSHILAIEQNSEIFNATFTAFRDASFSKTKYINLNRHSLEPLIKGYGALGARKIVPLKLNRGYMLNRKFYDGFIKDASAILQLYWKNRITTIHMGRLWCKNLFQNLPFLAKSSAFSELLTEKPVVSVGAGESLEYTIDFLKSHRDKFFLAAADTAVTTLLLNDLKPDLVIVLESQHANIYDFYSKEAFALPAAVDLTSSPELIRKFTGPVYFFLSDFTESSLFKLLNNAGLRPAVIPPLGSVGIASLFLSSLLTNQNVIYSGLDFSFIPDKYHASGSPSHTISMLKDGRTASPGFFSAAFSANRKKVIDKSGRSVYTDLTMLSYAETLKELASKSSRFHDISKVGIARKTEQNPELPAEQLLKTAGGISDNNFNIDLFCEMYTASEVEKLERVQSFLRSEINKLENIITDVVSFQNSRSGNDVIDKKLESSLKDVDYTWLFFPDTGPLPSSSNSFLKRFLYSAAWFKNLLINTASQL